MAEKQDQEENAEINLSIEHLQHLQRRLSFMRAALITTYIVIMLGILGAWVLR